MTPGTSANATAAKNGSLRLRSARKIGWAAAVLGRRAENLQIPANILVRTLVFIIEDFSDDIDVVTRDRCVLSCVLSAVYFVCKCLVINSTVREGFEPSIPFRGMTL